MYKPEVTIKLMRERFWGPKAIERRIKRCCADNPDCPIQTECLVEYDAYVTNTDSKRVIDARS